MGDGSARLLITGAAGQIGQMLLPRLQGPLRVLDVNDAPAGAVSERVEWVRGSATDLQDMTEALRGAEAVLHLAGISSEGPWPDILDANVGGTYCVLEAARATGVRRVVLASSNHAVGFYSRDDARGEELPADVPARPDTYYGWSKAAGEALGRLYADRFGMDVICLRIGSCKDRPADTRELETWLSPDDVARLVETCLRAERPGFRIVWGVSRNTRRWWSLAAGQALGFEPADDAEAWAGAIDDPGPEDATRDLLGGGYCSAPLGEWMGR